MGSQRCLSRPKHVEQVCLPKHCGNCGNSNVSQKQLKGCLQLGNHLSGSPWCFLSPHARPVKAFTCCAWSGGLQHHSSSSFHMLRVHGVISRAQLLQSSSRKTTSGFTVAESCYFSVSLYSMCWAFHGLCLSHALLSDGHPRMQLNSARSGLRPRAPAKASLRRRICAQCFEASLPVLPGSSRAPRTPEP